MIKNSCIIQISVCRFFGAASIIFSVIWRRRLLHSEIHPIFMLSLSDCLLATLWITGSSVWLSSAKDNALWCYALTLITAVRNLCFFFYFSTLS